jgi:hypothetical protein
MNCYSSGKEKEDRAVTCLAGMRQGSNSDSASRGLGVQKEREKKRGGRGGECMKTRGHQLSMRRSLTGFDFRFFDYQEKFIHYATEGPLICNNLGYSLLSATV